MAWKPAPGEGYGTATFSLTTVVAPDFCLFANPARQYVFIQLISGGPVALGMGWLPSDSEHGILLTSGTNDAYEMCASAGNLFVGDIYAAGTGLIGITEGV